MGEKEMIYVFVLAAVVVLLLTFVATHNIGTNNGVFHYSPETTSEDTVMPAPKDGGWEFLTDDNDFETYRRKVPGGWIVRTIEDIYHGGGDALCFVPDPNYDWKV